MLSFLFSRDCNPEYFRRDVIFSSPYNHVLSVVCGHGTFVTARAIDLNLCTYVPLGHMTYQTKFQSDLILGHAP
jgi:hypothetical protein